MTDMKTPDTPSSDHAAMMPYWQMIAAILGGADTMRAAGTTYLPKFPNETEGDYEYRRGNAKFTNIFGDIVETLSSKPFEQELTVDGSDDAIDELLEDIDGQGNHLHVFAADLFHAGVADAISWLMVDYTRDVPEGATKAQEREIGARPYWVHIPALNLLAAYSERIGGKDQFVHVRIREDTVIRDGFGEITKERVRVLDRAVAYDESGNAVSAGAPTWAVHEKREKTNGVGSEWIVIAEGQMTIDVIPLVPFIAGKRLGASWKVRPPLKDAAHLQIKHYQYESGLDHAAEMTCFPMLAGNGVEPPKGDDGKIQSVPVGPMAVLYAPMGNEGRHGQWEVIEPAATSLTFIADHMVKATEAQIRELGRQPLTAQSGNITTITAAFAGDKAHTVVEAWALNLKDTLENGLALTARWMKSNAEPVVSVNTDFSLSLKEDTGADSIEKARERGDLSQETYW
ncbi:DUF4055 domain-containing protein, partial [Roseibium sp. RKSG952]|uniref:DUF4055 domain-containing protein n=1 Tax=Roseibium sp. RKSG952 TaxID=2529384 RepID=UPI0012BB8EAF